MTKAELCVQDRAPVTRTIPIDSTVRLNVAYQTTHGERLIELLADSSGGWTLQERSPASGATVLVQGNIHGAIIASIRRT